MVKDKKLRVLFLCTGNSARSILAEALLNHLGAAEFEAFSAGSQPTGQVNPLALKTLSENRIPAPGARSKFWDEFEKSEPMDIIITVCDQAAQEPCPVWPGHPVTLHWGMPDPAAVEGTLEEKSVAFLKTQLSLNVKILDFLALAAKNPDKESFLSELKG